MMGVTDGVLDSARRHVLIVDDDLATTQTYAHLLRLEGFSVQTALDAETALDYVQRHPPDAIIVDLRMPKMDGLELLRVLRASHDYHAIPAAIVTGDYGVDERTVQAITELGVRTVLKPLWLDDLVVLVNSMLSC
jgi:two-component system, NtrC family, response regulator AtoC